MNNIAEQFIATNKANLQALEGLTTQAYGGVEKLVELNLAASKAALSESFIHAKAVIGAKDAQELIALQSGFLKPLAEKSAAYVQHVQTIATSSSSEFTKAIEAKTAEAKKAFSGVVETIAKSAPAGTESAVAAFKNALTVGQDAVESAQTSAKNAVEVAVDAVKKASKVA